MESVVALIVTFSSIVGITYLFVSSRHKERMALIDKGVDASLFTNKNRKIKPIWKVLLVNTSLLLIGIGVGVFIGGVMDQYSQLDGEIAFPGSIFTMAGIALFIGFRITQNFD